MLGYTKKCHQRLPNPKEMKPPKGRQTAMNTVGLGAEQQHTQTSQAGETHTELAVSKKQFNNAVSAPSSSRR